MKITVYSRILWQISFKEDTNFLIVLKIKTEPRQKPPSIRVDYKTRLIERVYKYHIRGFRTYSLYQE